MKEVLGVKYYSTDETAKMIGVVRRTIERYRADGKIAPTIIGRSLFYTEADIKSLIASPK